MQSAPSTEDCVPNTGGKRYEVQKLWKFIGSSVYHLCGL